MVAAKAVGDLDTCGSEGCSLKEGGVCGVHELEAQKIMRVEKVCEEIPKILKFMHLAVGGILTVGSLGTILILGAYNYTSKEGEERRNADNQIIQNHAQDEAARDAAMLQLLLTNKEE